MSPTLTLERSPRSRRRPCRRSGHRRWPDGEEVCQRHHLGSRDTHAVDCVQGLPFRQRMEVKAADREVAEAGLHAAVLLTRRVRLERRRRGQRLQQPRCHHIARRAQSAIGRAFSSSSFLPGWPQSLSSRRIRVGHFGRRGYRLRVRREQTVNVLRADRPRAATGKEVVPGGQAADDDDVAAHVGRQRVATLSEHLRRERNAS